MFRLIFSVCTLSAIAVILTLTAGPSQTAEARFIRWDCSDWQPYPAVADADDQLASAILETLAANRGKTLYCGLDQSDTWTKRQVYDNAHAHNDRDRTQYDGSQGQGRFRGFTAGQEGWLTDGEHGITGVSPERIFEFPQQERGRGRRRTRTIKFDVGSGPADTDNCIVPTRQSRSEVNPADPGGLICTTLWSAWTTNWRSLTVGTVLRREARNLYSGRSENANNWQFSWRTRARTAGLATPAAASGGTLTEDGWKALAATAAKAACRSRGGRYVNGSADFGPGHNDERGAGTNDVEFMGNFHGWYYDYRRQSEVVSGGSANNYQAKARESRTWSGVCTKKVRGSRRR